MCIVGGCPSCRLNLVAEAKLDTSAVCGHCGGIWLSGRNVRTIMQQDANTNLYDGIFVYREGGSESLKERSCPECENQKLYLMSYRSVEIDVCENCKGIFFDKQELERLVPDWREKASNITGMSLVEIFVYLFAALLK